MDTGDDWRLPPSSSYHWHFWLATSYVVAHYLVYPVLKAYLQGMNFEIMWSIQGHSDAVYVFNSLCSYFLLWLSLRCRFWAIALPVMAILLPVFLRNDIVRLAHYLTKKMFVNEVEKVREQPACSARVQLIDPPADFQTGLRPDLGLPGLRNIGIYRYWFSGIDLQYHPLILFFELLSLPTSLIYSIPSINLWCTSYIIPYSFIFFPFHTVVTKGNTWLFKFVSL